MVFWWLVQPYFCQFPSATRESALAFWIVLACLLVAIGSILATCGCDNDVSLDRCHEFDSVLVSLTVVLVHKRCHPLVWGRPDLADRSQASMVGCVEVEMNCCSRFIV